MPRIPLRDRLAVVGSIILRLFAPVAVHAANFTAPEPEFVQTAEQARSESARFWSGQDLPGDWHVPCPIHVRVCEEAGLGRTTFTFDRGEVGGWSMFLAGRRESLLKDVLPHEVDHMVRASLVRHPLPRWLDEGCATLMESAVSHAQCRRNLPACLDQPIDAPFLDTADYPCDSAATGRLYLIGFSLVEFLLERDGPQTLLRFQSDPRPPSRKLEQYYRLNVAELDRAWRPWANERAGHGPDCQSVQCPRHFPRAKPADGLPAPLATPQLPILTVYTSRWCGPCRQFWRDFQTRDEFRLALTQRFQVQGVDVDAHPQALRQPGLTAVPSFVTPLVRIEGYEGPDWLLARLGLAAASIEPATSPQAPPATAPAPSPPSPPLSRLLAPIVPSLPPPSPKGPRDLAPAVTPLLGDDGDAVPPPPSLPAAGTEPSPPTVPRIQPRPQPAAPVPALPATSSAHAITAPVGRILDVAPLVFTTLQLLGIVGGSVATGGLGALVLPLLVRLWRRRRTRRLNHAASPEEGGAAERPAPFPRELDEARQLLALRQSEGRVAVLDALRGMFLDDELERLSETADASTLTVLQQLRSRLDARIDEVAPLTTRWNE